MSTCNRLELEALGSWPIMPNYFPGTALRNSCNEWRLRAVQMTKWKVTCLSMSVVLWSLRAIVQWRSNCEWQKKNEYRKRVVAITYIKHCEGRQHWRSATKTSWAPGICHFERSVTISTKAVWRATTQGSILKPPKFYRWGAFRVYPRSLKQVVGLLKT